MCISWISCANKLELGKGSPEKREIENHFYLIPKKNKKIHLAISLEVSRSHAQLEGDFFLINVVTRSLLCCPTNQPTQVDQRQTSLYSPVATSFLILLIAILKFFKIMPSTELANHGSGAMFLLIWGWKISKYVLTPLSTFETGRKRKGEIELKILCPKFWVI